MIPNAIHLINFLSAVVAYPTTKSSPQMGAAKVYVKSDSEVTVYNGITAQCGAKYKPDSPLRAFVRTDGKVVAVAGYITNYAMQGNSIDSLNLNCRPILSSEESSDDANLSDRSWIASTWTPDGRQVSALIHDEYQSQRFEGKCDFKSYMKCWYNTVTNYYSQDGGNTFNKRTKLFAIGPYVKFSRSAGKHIGFYNPSNIIEKNGFAYTFVFTNGFSSQRPGVCLFRSPIKDMVNWYGWKNGSFSVKMESPYSSLPNQANCQVLNNLGSIVGSVVWSENLKLFIAATSSTSPISHDIKIAYSTSPNMFDWSKSEVLIDKPTMWSKGCSDIFRYGYPSMLPREPLDRNFSNIKNDGYLFMTRFHVKDCNLSDVRDLVRFKFNIQR